MSANHHHRRRAFSAAAAAGGGGGDVVHEGQVQVAHILMDPKDEPKLAELYERIVNDVDTLADLAPEYSMCPSKSNGGVIGWIGRGQTVGPFEDVAFTTPVGAVAKATTNFGVHIIQVLDAREQPAAPVDVSVEDLREVLEGDLDEVNLIDVREQNEWDTAKLAQFSLKPLSQLAEWAPTATQDFDPSKPTYVMCKAGVRSMRAAMVLIDQGFTDVRNVAGGIDAWARTVDPNMNKY